MTLRADSPGCTAADPVDAFFFGPSDGQLFGCYHRPRSDFARDTAVLLCYPWGREYLAAHRAFRLLASVLSDIGYPVLRFDYFGTGDSAGSAASCTLRRWLDDVSLALDELRSRAEVERTCLGGLRLGGTIAALAATEHGSAGGLVLWQPILDGAAYLDELRVQQRDMAWQAFSTIPKGLEATSSGEILGFPLSGGLHDELRHLDLLTIPAPDGPVLLIDNDEREPSASLHTHLLTHQCQVTYACRSSFAIWHEDVDKGLVPRPTLQQIAAWLERTCP